MNFKHSFNNDLGNKPETNQQQGSQNQGNNFNVVPQQQYQQNGINQNYNSGNVGQDGQMFQQYGQPGGQNPLQKQYGQQRNMGSQQFPKNYNKLNSSDSSQSQQNLMQRSPQNIGQAQYEQQTTQGSQYQQNMNAQNYNAMNPNQVGQGGQNQSIAERIANMQNSNAIKPSDLLNASLDPNINVGLGKNMNIGVPMANDFFDDQQQKSYHLDAVTNLEKIKCQCKNCRKKARPWLTVLVTLLIVLAILGGGIGAVFGFCSQIRDWLLKPDPTPAEVADDGD